MLQNKIDWLNSRIYDDDKTKKKILITRTGKEHKIQQIRIQFHQELHEEKMKFIKMSKLEHSASMIEELKRSILAMMTDYLNKEKDCMAQRDDSDNPIVNILTGLTGQDFSELSPILSQRSLSPPPAPEEIPEIVSKQKSKKFDQPY